MENFENSSIYPEEIRHFNWGAFLLNWIWGIMHGRYITLWYFPACLIPFVGPLAICFWFGIMGNRWAWDSREWESVEKFNESQRFWVKLWLVLFIFAIIITAKLIFILALAGSAET